LILIFHTLTWFASCEFDLHCSPLCKTICKHSHFNPRIEWVLKHAWKKVSISRWWLRFVIFLSFYLVPRICIDLSVPVVFYHTKIHPTTNARVNLINKSLRISWNDVHFIRSTCIVFSRSWQKFLIKYFIQFFKFLFSLFLFFIFFILFYNLIV